MNLWGRRRGGALLVGTVLAGLLAGCASEPRAPEPTATPGPGIGTVTVAPDGVQEVTLQTQDDYVFTPDSFTVAPGPVRLTVLNAADDLTHSLRFRPGEGPEPIEEEIPLVAPGDSRTIEFDVSRPGEYLFECTFHIRLGQVGTMTVSDG